jgi:hypothetical protein
MDAERDERQRQQMHDDNRATGQPAPDSALPLIARVGSRMHGQDSGEPVRIDRTVRHTESR